MHRVLGSIAAFSALATLAFSDRVRAQAPDVSVSEEADLILSGGEVYTREGWAESLAIKRGVILAVGDDAAVREYMGGGTQVIELDGTTVFPGLHDMHVHAMGAGLAQRECQFPQGSSLAVVQEAVADCAAARGSGEWVTGGQWDTSSLGSEPHRSMLDSVAPANPVALIDISYHSYFVNSRALEIAGVTADTPDPDGGVIERDENGEPTGVLRETARGLIASVIPPVAPEDRIDALKWSLDTMLSLGVTSFTDAGVDDAALKAYAALSDRGELKTRVRGCLRPALDAGAADLTQRALLYARERFAPDCVKLVLDGVPTDGHTAAMVDPYADASSGDEARARGILMVPPATLIANVIDLDARGYTVKMHAAGDAAVRAGLDAIAAAREANGFTGNLHNVSHNSFVQMTDIERARGIGATFEMSPYIWYPNPIIPDVEKAIGAERMERWTPVKDAIDSGALVVPGSDWSVVPSVNPWIGIETLVTRQAPGGVGEPLGDPITLEQAIDMYTVNSARQMGNANKTGRIAPGLLADLIVVDRNPFEIPITEVHETRVTYVLIDGEVVHGGGP